MFPERTRSTPAPAWQWMSVSLQKDFGQTYQNKKWRRARGIARKSTSLRHSNSFQARQLRPRAKQPLLPSLHRGCVSSLSTSSLSFHPSLPAFPSPPLPSPLRAWVYDFTALSLSPCICPSNLSEHFRQAFIYWPAFGNSVPGATGTFFKMATKYMSNKRHWKQNFRWIMRILWLFLDFEKCYSASEILNIIKH